MILYIMMEWAIIFTFPRLLKVIDMQGFIY